jgi:hypothetical protein
VIGHPPLPFDSKPFDLEMTINKERQDKTRDQRYVRGLFAGGTFCYQAQQIFQDTGFSVYSNSSIKGNRALPDPFQSSGHALIDMGADEFTAGRPHPMIDSRLRCERILAEIQDPQVAILLLDLILGYNASQDPAGELVPAILEAKNTVKRNGGSLSVIASVCGTQEDPQDLKQQIDQLEEAGVAVFTSSTRAALFCARLAATLQGAIDGE